MGILSKAKNIFAGEENWSTEPVERLSYYSYFAGQNMIYTLFNVCLTTYLLFLGIDPIKSGTVMLAVKVWDAVNDTLFGVIFDSIKFKSGKKYLPWLRISTILIPIATILTFVIPSNSSEAFKLGWFAVAYILWDTAYTLCDVPIFGVLTSMSLSVDERNSIQSYKSIYTYIGVGITSTLSTILISEKVGMNYGMITLIICVMAFSLMSPASFKLQERFRAENEETFTIKSMFAYLVKNKYLLIYSAFNWRLLTIAGFTVQYDLSNPSYKGTGDKPDRFLLNIAGGVNSASNQNRSFDRLLEAPSVKALNYFATCDLKRLFTSSADKKTEKELKEFTTDYISIHFEKIYDTLSVLNNL